MSKYRLPLAALAIGAVLSVGPGTVRGIAQRGEVDNVWVRRVAEAGAFTPVRDLSGTLELSQFSELPNPRDLRSGCTRRTDAEQMALQAYEEQAAAIEAEPAAATRDVHELALREISAAQIRSFQGDMTASSAHLRAALDALRAAGSRAPADDVHTATALLGISELRRGEVENCVHDPNASRCIFPLQKPGQHTATSGATAAFDAFTDALRDDPSDLELRWLLTLSGMALGRYPAGIPDALRIDTSSVDSTEPAPRFVDDAASVGLNVTSRAGGVIVDDMNGDGLLDVVFTNVDPCEPMRLFEQQRNGTFQDVSTRAGLDQQLAGINTVQTDYDNDGRPDIFVMRGGWQVPMRNSLLHQEADGTFTDVTERAGLLDVPHRTHSAVWADYDNDGLLDLFVGHEQSTSRLYHNRGDGTFEEVAARAGIRLDTFVKGAAWGDYDRDGYPDLYVSNYGERNVLYHNNGNGTFTDVTPLMHVDRPILSFATWFFDYDNDGWPDLFVADFVPSVSETVKAYVGQAPTAETLRLYRNVQGRRFDDVTKAVGLDRVTMTMGANFGDYDNDGWLDVYLGTGSPSYAALVPNLLFHNRDGQRFTDVTSVTGTGHLQKGHGIAFADIDNDGDEDLFVNIGGFTRGDAYTKVLFRNPGNGNNWLTLKLQGTRTNRMALGARVSILARNPDGSTRRIERTIGTGGSFGASPAQLHVGVGTATAVERVEIYWPVSKQTQVLQNVPLRHTTVVSEPPLPRSTAPAPGSR